MSEKRLFGQRPAPLPAGQLPINLPFTKMEGAGNDYIYIEEFQKVLENPAALAVHLSDRNFGIGGDGLVLMGPSLVADFRMRIFNADGSEAEMCGNASRCVGKYLYEHGFTSRKEIALETASGIKTLHLQTKKGNVVRVRVDMGQPALDPVAVPVLAASPFIHQPLEAAGRTWHGTALSMGNPHLVIPVPDVAALDLERMGPLFENHPLFPQRVNTEFVEIVDAEHVRMRVWERGSGETLACGTGACATVVACVLNGLTGRAVAVSLRGGTLTVEWSQSGAVFMTGPATEVFSGIFEPR